jgi:hypothetical protein
VLLDSFNHDDAFRPATQEFARRQDMATLVLFE